MSKESLWNVVEDRLRNNPTLAGYVKNVYNFNRKKILDAELPCIIMHPLATDEEYADFPKRKQDFVKIEIRAIIDVRNNLNDAVCGTTDYIGLYRFEEDIKNAIENQVNGLTDDLGFALQGHYPKLKTTAYNNLEDVSAEVVLECEVDGRYFFVGQR